MAQAEIPAVVAHTYWAILAYSNETIATTLTHYILSWDVYVCIEVALREVPMGLGVLQGLGEGPIKSGSNVPTREYHRSASRTLAHTCTLGVRSVANFTLGS